MSPRGPTAPKRRGKVKKKHTVGKVLIGRLARARPGHRAGRRLPLPPPQRQPQRARRHRPAREPPRQEGGRGPQGAAQRPGDGVGHPRGRGQQHRQPDRWRPARSDTTILLHVSADRKRAYGISIPRDSLVTRPECKTKGGETIPGGTDVMWNEAFSVGGPACTIQQFEQITGVYIDHFVVVDFAGFEDMVDAIGGVEVCIPEDISDPAHGINIPAGTREIAGARGAQLRARPLHAGRRLRHRPDLAPAGVHRLDGEQGQVRQRAGPAGPAGAVPRGGDEVAHRRQGPVEHREDRRPRAAVPGHRARQDPVHHRAVGVRPAPGVRRAASPGCRRPTRCGARSPPTSR